nr:hypothetical protein [Tanacetum cinerariifolium]
KSKRLRLVKEMNLLCANLTERVNERCEIIAELDRLSGSIVAVESDKLLRELNDVDLAKGRAMMAAIRKSKRLRLVKEMNLLCANLTERVNERCEIIAELDRLSGSIVAVESDKLLRELNDVDLAKGRAMMAAI